MRSTVHQGVYKFRSLFRPYVKRYSSIIWHHHHGESVLSVRIVIRRGVAYRCGIALLL
ncbi:hypothetical protein BDY19DRAFT_977902, partial [Irpex rosettiformis]